MSTETIDQVVVGWSTFNKMNSGVVGRLEGYFDTSSTFYFLCCEQHVQYTALQTFFLFITVNLSCSFGRQNWYLGSIGGNDNGKSRNNNIIII